jgi:hypothetical protein
LTALKIKRRRGEKQKSGKSITKNMVKNITLRIQKYTLKIRNNCNRRRKIKIEKATPNWEGDELIKLVYLKAQEFGFAVDHIIPVNHELVCGLHTWNNLQLLSTSENSKKYNNFIQDW